MPEPTPFPSAPKRNGPGPQRKKRPSPHRDRRHAHQPKPPEDPLTGTVLRAAQETSELLGPCLPVAFYRSVFLNRLRQHRVPFQESPRIALRHRDKVADDFACDLLCDNQLLVNLHESSGEFSHDQIVAAGAAARQFSAKSALLVGFGGEETAHRRLHGHGDQFPSIAQDEMTRGVTVEKADELRVAMLCRSLLRIGRAHGLGFGEKTYLGLLRVEFRAEALDFREEPEVSISCDGTSLGEIKLRHCMEIQRSGVLLVTAQREGIRHLDRSWMQTALKSLRLPWGLIAHFGRRRFEWRWVQATAPIIASPAATRNVPNPPQ